MIYGIQYLRGYSALLVAAFHLHAAALNEGNSTSLWQIFSSGAIGVDIFLVISGFVIFSAAQRTHNWKASDFLVRRFFRIFPLYWISLAIITSLGIGLYILNGDNSRRYHLLDILDDIFLIPQQEYILIVSWTLTLEVIFYIIFALLFRKNSHIYFLIAIVIWSLFSFSLSIYSNDRNWLQFVFHPAVPALAFGTIIASKFSELPHRTAYILCLIGIVGIIINHCFFLDLSAANYRALSSGIPASVLVWGLVNMRLPFKEIHNFLGDISYALYLFHIPTYLIAGFAIERVFNLNPYHSDIIMLIMLLLSLVVSSFLHYYIDRPIQRFVKSRF